MIRKNNVILELADLSFAREVGGRSLRIVNNFSATIHEGEFVSIVGPSGCGKSTIIGLICSALFPCGGAIRFPNGRPKLGVQFQSDALFPWRQVWSNLGYPQEILRLGKDARRSHAAELCELVKLAPSTFLDRYPAELSGGERRRVSLAMALSANPALLLLDEATSSLDWSTRRAMQEMLQRLCASRRLTTLSVTHDVEEAVWLSDRVLILEGGRCKADYAISLPRPRTQATRVDKEFINAVTSIADLLTSEICPDKI